MDAGGGRRPARPPSRRTHDPAPACAGYQTSAHDVEQWDFGDKPAEAREHKSRTLGFKLSDHHQPSGWNRQFGNKITGGWDRIAGLARRRRSKPVRTRLPVPPIRQRSPDRPGQVSGETLGTMDPGTANSRARRCRIDRPALSGRSRSRGKPVARSGWAGRSARSSGRAVKGSVWRKLPTKEPVVGLRRCPRHHLSAELAREQRLPRSTNCDESACEGRPLVDRRRPRRTCREQRRLSARSAPRHHRQRLFIRWSSAKRQQWHQAYGGASLPLNGTPGAGAFGCHRPRRRVSCVDSFNNLMGATPPQGWCAHQVRLTWATDAPASAATVADVACGTGRSRPVPSSGAHESFSAALGRRTAG